MLGSVVGHYQILEKIGEGGMGAVFKARDTHLDRLAAIKVLPAKKVADPERRRRFLQEAKAASALNHPNIVTVYDATNEGGVDYIAMEYIAGRTLDEVLRKKPLRINEALGYAIQIADALARAHAAGIVHRDLKPSNVMVDEHGLVKVLDFGLAKLTEAESSDEAATATLRPQTEDGVVVGTAAYMSPEQAEGRKVDSRTDVFSFGLVLYELLTGVNPFRRESRISTMAAVINEEPKPFTEHAVILPPELERAIARCLRKEPQRRWQNMADLKSLLEDLKEESESGASASARRAQPPASRKRIAVLAAAGLVLLAAAAALAWRFLGRSGGPAAITPSRVTFDTGITGYPAISSDGKIIAYASDRSGDGKVDIWVRHVDRVQPIRRTNAPGGASMPSLSPDGSRIVFRSERGDGGLYIMDTLGGEERKIADEGVYPRFSPDGRWIAYTRRAATNLHEHNKVLVMPSQGGEARPVDPEYGSILDPMAQGAIWSPDSRFLLYLGVSETKPRLQWRMAAFDGATATSVDVSKWFPTMEWVRFPTAWPSKDTLIVVQGATIEGLNLFRVPLVPGSFQAAGAPEPLTSGPGLRYGVAASAEGTVLFAILTWVPNIWAIPFDPATGKATGEPKQISTDSATKNTATASRDGSTIACSAVTGYSAGRKVEVRVRDLSSGRETTLSDSAGLVAKNEKLSANGSLVTYLETTPEGVATMIAPAGGGTPKRLCLGCTVSDFFPGDRDVLAVRGRGEVFRQPIDGGTPALLIATKAGAVIDPRVSNDGRRIAFAFMRNDATASIAIAKVQDQPPPEKEWITVSESRARWFGEPNWSPDDTSLYYLNDAHGVTCVWGRRLDRASGRPSGDPFEAFHGGDAKRGLLGPRRQTGLVVTPDRIFTLLAEIGGNLWMLKLPGK